MNAYLCVDGSDSRDKPKLYRLQHSITEVGSDCTEDGAIQVTGRHILLLYVYLSNGDNPFHQKILIINFNKEGSGNIVLLALFMSS